MISPKPYGLVTLYELMIRYRLDMLAIFLLSCQIASRDFMYLDAMKKELPENNEYIEGLTKMIEGLNLCMKHADGDKSLIAQISAFSKQLQNGSDKRPGVLNANLRQIILGVEEVLTSRLFMFVPEDQAKYYMNLEHYGDSVSMFPDALGDMVEASNCYAAGRPTACVFHSMRIAEHGLRHIANELGVEVNLNGKPCPVEYATWEQVLVKIETKRQDLRKEVKSKEHEDKTIQYAGLADNCAHLKDLWRNPTMHSRGLYSMPEALGAMNRVSEFMNLIAGSIYAPPPDVNLTKAMKVLVEMTNEMRQLS